MEIVLLLTCSTSSGMGRSKGWTNRVAAHCANTSLESSEIWCGALSCSTRENASSKIIRNFGTCPQKYSPTLF